jgi:hypothetical protein
MADPISYGYSDALTNTDTFSTVYKVDFDTNTFIVTLPTTTPLDLGVGGVAIMSDNQFSLTGAQAAVTGSTLSNNFEAVSEFVGINGAFKTYLDNTYGAGNWSATYTGYSTVDAVPRVLAGPPDVNSGLDQPIISINFGPNIPSPPPGFEGGLDYFVLSSQATLPTDGGVAVYAPYYYSCFEKNTLIKTPSGEVPVHELKIGDAILTADGRAVDVKWVGYQAINAFFAKKHDTMPVRLMAGSLGNNLPKNDLYVSPDHAFLIDGLLINAAALVNEETIAQVQEWAGDVEYYHIETEDHEIILAEGVPAETLLDNSGREKFANYAEFQELYPQGKVTIELDLPRVKFTRQLPKLIKDRIAKVAESLRGKAELVA